MTDHNTDMKWFYRTILFCLIVLMSYVVFQTQYNFAHWVPHRLLKSIGIPYQALLYFERNADVILHLLGAFVITLLIIKSDFSMILKHQIWIVALVCAALFLVEIYQQQIGRGFDLWDLILGIVGCVMAMLISTKNHKEKLSKT